MRIYCSGFESENSFGHGLDKIFLKELKQFKNIVYIKGGEAKEEKSIIKYIPSFRNHFKKIGILFDNEILIKPDMKIEDAKKDLIKVTNEYEEFYLLQDYLREDGLKDISAIICDDTIKKYTEYDGRMWKTTKNDVVLIKKIRND